MNIRLFAVWLAAAVVVGLVVPQDCPAPLIWRKGEGWVYERGGVPTAKTPNEQLAIGKQLQEQGKYDDAVASFRRLVRRWPTSFAAQEGRFRLAESLSALGYHLAAHKEYQQLISKHPNTEYFDTVLQRQFDIATRFYEGEKLKTWRFRLFQALDKAIEIYEQIVKNGPYSPVAPEAQFRIGLTHERMREYASAVRAYEKLLERYPRHPRAEDAQFQIGVAYMREAQRFEYDQNAANKSIAAFTDFILRFPNSDKLALAEDYRTGLKQEQAKGLYRIGEFYEKRKKYTAALIYYNEVIEQNPQSDWATAAREKVASLTPKTTPESTATP